MNQLKSTSQFDRIKDWYVFQSRIYDLTRWTFLFGREKIIKLLPFTKNQEFSVLEVGCGTGTTLKYLADRFPKARLTGYDLSGDMLNVAEAKLDKYGERIELRNEAYPPGRVLSEKYDLVLFSYCLSMINPGFDVLLDQANSDLKENGILALVDFHNTDYVFYKNFMDENHVTLEAQLLPALEKRFVPKTVKIKKGLLGIWRYLLFVGEKSN
ncbi:class I SAM-dependent methyltransferase [Flexithrix dorotheae]|uniref:class I SAM-dependent methyltransferase n=1 Tax=Flexithrix dorotheae TaxID=70993 RepID=UPI00036B278D|nr:class I SAM-dependent methyltransferase [Flexithrix dorotheae]